LILAEGTGIEKQSNQGRKLETPLRICLSPYLAKKIKKEKDLLCSEQGLHRNFCFCAIFSANRAASLEALPIIS
jgi:hypothetical protein